MIYSLHLDESGDFAKPGGCPILGGVLLAGPPTAAREQAMKRALLDEFPGLPWPLHAAEIVLPMAPVGWRLAERGVDDPALAPAVDRALALLHGTEELRALRESWKPEKRITSDGLRAAGRCSGKLRSIDSATWGSLNRAAADRRARLTERARTLALSADPGAFLIVARAALRTGSPESAEQPAGVGATAASPAREPTDSAPRRSANQERWLSALTATVERAALLLGPRDQLFVHVSRYYGLRDPETLRATRTPEVPGPPHVMSRALPAEAPTAGAVIADFLLFPLRQRIDEAGRRLTSYRALAATVADHMLPLEGGSARCARAMPTALVDGPTRAMLHERLGGQPRPPLLERLLDVRTRWDRDQARAWLEAL